MIYVHSLIWELSNLEIKCELTGSGDGEAMNRDESEWPEVNTRIWALRTPPRTRPVFGKNDLLPGLPDKSIRRYIVLLPEIRVAFSEACTNGE